MWRMSQKFLIGKILFEDIKHVIKLSRDVHAICPVQVYVIGQHMAYTKESERVYIVASVNRPTYWNTYRN